MPDAMTVWLVAVLVFGGGMWVLMTVGEQRGKGAIAKPRRPGWIARRRARGGISHKRDRVGVGYTSATRSVHLSIARARRPRRCVRRSGLSGKTTFLQLLVEATAGRMPVVIVDPKGSPGARGDGARPRRPWCGRSTASYRPICSTRDRGRCPTCCSRPRTTPPTRARTGMRPTSARCGRPGRSLYGTSRWIWPNCGGCSTVQTLLRALEPYRGRDPRIGDWLERLEHQHGGIEDSGARGLDRALGVRCWTAWPCAARCGPVPKRCGSRTCWPRTAWCCSSWTPRSTRTPRARSRAGCCSAWARLARQLGDCDPVRNRHRGRCSWSTRSARWARAARHLRGLVGTSTRERPGRRAGHPGPERPGGGRPRAAAAGPAGHGLAARVPPGQPTGRERMRGAVRPALDARRRRGAATACSRRARSSGRG